jgi:hypothetical protein
MKITIKRLFDNNKNEKGAILTAFVGHVTNAKQKGIIELALQDYAAYTLYPNVGLSIYSDIHEDSPSIVAIKDTSDLSYEEINLPIVI